MTAAAPAEAHAPPSATDIRWLGGSGAERVLVRTNRGLIVGDPAAKAFRLVCNDAFDAALVEVVPTAELANGGLLLGTYAAGLLRSDEALCDFEPVGPREVSPVALEADANGTARALLLPLDGAEGGLFESDDGATTFRAVSQVGSAPTALVSAPSNPRRVYVSANSTSGNVSIGHLLVSDDGGQSFTDHVLELDGSELRAFVLAVDPEDPERVFVRTQSRDQISPERLLRSEDGGKTFQTAFRAEGPLTIALGEGGTVWAGSATDLYRSLDSGASFERVPDHGLARVECLAFRGQRLYACALKGLEFGVLVSADAGATFDWFLRFPEVTSRAQCPPASDEGTRCAAAFEDWSLEQLVPAGGAGAEPVPAQISAAKGDSSAGCRIGAPRGGSLDLAWLGLLGLSAFRRRGRTAHD